MITWVPTPKSLISEYLLGGSYPSPLREDGSSANSNSGPRISIHPKEIGDDTHAEDNYSQGFTTVANVGFPAEDASR